MFAVMCTVPASAVTLTLTGVVLFGLHMQRQALVLHTLPVTPCLLPMFVIIMFTPFGASGAAGGFANASDTNSRAPLPTLPLTLGIVLEEAAEGRVGLLSRGLATERRDDRVEHARGSVHLLGVWGYRARGYC